jgi:hypothetical protein
MTPCGLVDICGRFRRMCCINLHDGIVTLYCMVSCPGRQQCSRSPQWESHMYRPLYLTLPLDCAWQKITRAVVATAIWQEGMMTHLTSSCYNPYTRYNPYLSSCPRTNPFCIQLRTDKRKNSDCTVIFVGSTPVTRSCVTDRPELAVAASDTSMWMCGSGKRTHCTVACRVVTMQRPQDKQIFRQRLGKQVPAAKDTNETMVQ